MYYDEDYEPTQEEMEEMDGLENTKVEHNNEVININFNTENFANGIVTAVVQSLKENIYREVVSGGEDIKSRPDFMRLLRRLEKLDVRQVYCMDPERLSRSGIYGAGEVLKVFDITNTLIATYDQTYNLKNPMDKKYLEMRMIQSADYRNYSKDVMNRGRKRSVKEGYFVGSAINSLFDGETVHIIGRALICLLKLC